MYLARIEGTLVAAAKHATLAGCRFLVARRMEADGALADEPIVLIDWMGAAAGQLVLVSTDGDLSRQRLGNTSPARLIVAGFIDSATQPSKEGKQ